MLATPLCAILVVLPLAVSGLSIAPPIDPCQNWHYAGNSCEGTDVCRLVEVQCFTTPCEPQVTCVKSPAPKGGCDYGDPVIDASGNLVPCSRCPHTTKCTGGSEQCCWQAPPPPVFPPCLLRPCPLGTDCEEEKVDPTCTGSSCALKAKCTVSNDDPCRTHKCAPGSICEALPTPCAPSDPPQPCPLVPVCRVVEKPTEKPGSCPPVEPGFGICPVECGNDFDCSGSKKCCKEQCGIFCTDPVFDPKPIPHPCALVDCRRGTQCRLQQGVCRDGPCSVEPLCVPVTEPVRATCPDGLSVVDSSNKELFCGKGPNSVPCPDSTFCETEHGVCCHRTTPEPFNPCILALCLQGHTCEARTPEVCLNPPCKPEAVCIPPDVDPCLEANCKRGYHCELIATPCARTDPPKPCPLVAECVRDPPGKSGTCPVVRPGTLGTCAEECSNDFDCEGIQKCCSNGCGHVCRDPADPVPHPCTLARCSRDYECRLQTYCEDNICSVGANCVTKMCPYGWPVVGSNNVALFCGRGPNRVECPESSSCNIHPTDRYAVCCPNDGVPLIQKCPVGLPVVDSNVVELSCGGGPNSVSCPEGTFCEHETGVCCHQSFPEPSKCPNGSPAIGRNSQEIFCGRGPTRQDCPVNTYCEVHPTDAYAVCCPKPPSPCELANCKPGYKCVEVVNPCKVAPCPVRAECVLDGKDGECPIPPPGQLGHCALLCSGDMDCKGTQKCCSNGCGRTCQAARVTYVDSDPCSKKRCRSNMVCRLKKVRCFRGRCPLRAVCMASSSVANTKICKSGYPIINLRRKQIKCDNCPENSLCVDGGCCWNSELIIKDGVCPKSVGFPGKCLNECTNDNMCSGTKKCCSKGCSRTCQHPLASYHPSDPCRKKKCRRGWVCQLKERHCRRKQKCPLKAICVRETTVTTPSSCKSGYPVLDRKRREICNHGDQFYCPEGTTSSGDVCCWKTGKPALPLKEKFGTCPNTGGLIGPCVDLCSRDDQCPRAQKCCGHGCGHRCKAPVKATYLPSDPCSKKRCRRGRVCRLKRDKKCKDCPPVAKCARMMYALGPKSCLSGYPVQDLATWRPICCLASPDVCPRKTVCVAGVCCWDRANDNLKG